VYIFGSQFNFIFTYNFYYSFPPEHLPVCLCKRGSGGGVDGERNVVGQELYGWNLDAKFNHNQITN